jgi:hypothetical protein
VPDAAAHFDWERVMHVPDEVRTTLADVALVRERQLHGACERCGA